MNPPLHAARPEAAVEPERSLKFQSGQDVGSAAQKESENCSEVARPSAKDFEVLRHVGSGNFSNVFHVRQGRSVTLNSKAAHVMKLPADYAMKKIRKADLHRLHKEKEVLMEKHCLSKLHCSTPLHNEIGRHSNIIKLYHTFQDNEHLYLVMEYCKEGELWEMISGIGLLDDDLARYFIAQLVNAVEFCHNRGIVHRDLKAENILIDTTGTLKLIDFGTALDIERPDLKGAGNRCRGTNGRVFEHFVGTAQFMAPEATKNQSSGRLSDLWSLGCTIYQILAGVPPFQGPSDFLVHLRSRNVELDIPPHFPPDAEDLVRSLLRPVPQERLSAYDVAPYSLSAVKSHAYFKGVDFNNLESIIGDRAPYPPLRDSCFGHMARMWERFSSKWVEAGWLHSSQQQLSLMELPATDNHSNTSNLMMDDVDSSFWDTPTRPAKLELYSRQLLQWKNAGCYSSIRKAQERLIYLKRLELERDEAFWDSRVKTFLDSGSPKRSSDSGDSSTDSNSAESPQSEP